MDDPEVLEALTAQLSFKEKVENNTSLAKDISLGAFNGGNYKKFADDNGLVIKNYKLSNIKQNDVFDEGLVKRIFLTKDGDINLLTNNTLISLEVANINFLKFSAFELEDAVFSKTDIFVTPSTKSATSSPNSPLIVS